MKLILFGLLIILSYSSFAQRQDPPLKIKIGTKEYNTNEVPSELNLPQRLNRVWIKWDTDRDPNAPSEWYTMVVGEEERSFRTDGIYYECKFTHDIKDFVCYIINQDRAMAGPGFVLKKRK
jgi:hypothetical protein